MPCIRGFLSQALPVQVLRDKARRITGNTNSLHLCITSGDPSQQEAFRHGNVRLLSPVSALPSPGVPGPGQPTDRAEDPRSTPCLPVWPLCRNQSTAGWRSWWILHS